MLVLGRKKNQSLKIGDNIYVKVTRISGGSVRLGLIAPNDVAITRIDAEDPIESVKSESKQDPFPVNVPVSCIGSVSNLDGNYVGTLQLTPAAARELSNCHYSLRLHTQFSQRNGAGSVLESIALRPFLGRIGD